MKRKVLIIIATVLPLFIAFVLSAGLVSNRAKPSKTNEGQKSITVQSLKVKNEPVNAAVSYQGRVNSYENVSLSAEVNGKILAGNVPLKEGAHFKKGDLLIQIYDKDVKANLQASKSNFLRTISLILPDLKIDFPTNYSKWESFFNAIELDKNLPEMPEVASEKEKIFLASNGVLSEYYSLQQQEINLTRYRIYAPFNGYFKKVNKEVGAIAGNGTEVAQLIRSDKLEVSVPVSVSDAKSIQEGNQVSIKTSKGNYTGEVARKAGFVDASTQSVNVYICYYPDRNSQLIEGEYVTVVFQLQSSTEGIKVPREAVIDNNTVYTVENSLLKKTSVEIIQQLDDYTYISGLDNSMVVVTESLVNVQEGQRVLTIEEN